MKPNSQRLLLSLYSQNSNLVQFPYHLIKLVLTGITAGGQRSLIHLLDQQNLIHKEMVANKITLTIAEQGRKALELQFPALKVTNDNRQGEWQLVLFLTPPTRDKNFRYLRKLILTSHGLPITRGVYAFHIEIPSEVQYMIDNLYKGNILIITGNTQLGFGSLRKLIIDYYRVPDLISTYSGISTEIRQLLRQFESLKRLTDGQKNSVAMVLDRIAQNAVSDPGIIDAYYPSSPNLSEVLIEYQRLLRLVSQKV